MQIYDAKRGALAATVGFLLQLFEGKGYYLHQDNYYKNVQLREALLQKNIKGCGITQLHFILLQDLTEELRKQTHGKSFSIRTKMHLSSASRTNNY
jgi:hypothetical protein